MNTKERLITYIKYKGLSQKRFEKLCGLANGYINNIKVSITPDKLQKIILQCEDLNPAWLLTGEGNMLRDGDNQPRFNRNNQGVPYYDIDFITSFDKIRKNSNLQPPLYYVDFEPFNNADWWVNVVGASMEPRLCHGDLIAIKKLNHWKDFLLFGEIYAVVTDEFRTIRIVSQAEDPNYFKLVPINNTGIFVAQDIAKDRIAEIYSVYGSMKRLF